MEGQEQVDKWVMFASHTTAIFLEGHWFHGKLISWEVDLVGVDLVGVDLVGVDLVGLDLVGLDFMRVDLVGGYQHE